ncbi:hypothetical protein [Pseudomonas sp. FR229a]|uniref:hypothetical protein n=1 Tax=Pseudomonas sp. FR229a TaxID=3040313 RepID=UPI00255717EE|nr:hypothetical protein [Pseudomonas sp. FR229a]
MSPKTPRKPPAATSHPPESAALPPRQLDGVSPALFPTPGLVDPTSPADAMGVQIVAPRLQPPAVEIFRMPTRGTQAPQANSPVHDYWLSEAFVHGMNPADADGFRWIVGRRFVDVEIDGAIKTTHVDRDESGVWRSKRLTERTASGARLYKNADSPTWRLTEQPVPQRAAVTVSAQPDAAPVAKRPRLASMTTPIDESRYRASQRSPDAQGYYEMQPVLRSNEDGIQFAFRDSFGNLRRVDPPEGGFNASPTHLKQWTDLEIWQLYGLQGRDITRFRVEAEAAGTPPQWADPVSTENPATDLLRDALRWLHPGLSLAEREAVLQSYNLLPDQLTRLRQEMEKQLAIPAWAQAHKRLLDDVDNPHRLDQFARDAVEQLNLKRNARHDWYHAENFLTPELREALLKRLGYLRNKNNCLYRTDIPALFRGDERTPFELANDGTMLPRYHHEPGATTHKPISATFSLKEAQVYASAPDPEYLRFNSQMHKYPGRDAADSSSDSDASDSSSSSSSDWSDPASPVTWDHERGYRSTRTRQTEMFLYALDTRNLEVVPHEENMMFNATARDTPPTWFPSDDFEGLISVTRSGLDAERIWLLNSAQTKGARVMDIKDMAGNSAERIEAATHAGHANKFEYDRLIDKAEAAALPIVRLSGNRNESGHDIVWP